MRILCVLCTLLVITVTSLARPQDGESTTKTTTALPLTTAIKKNDSLSGTPASIGKSNEKPNNAVTYTTPSVTTVEKQKEHEELMTTPTKTATLVTSDSKIDSTSAITLSDKISTTTAVASTDITTTTTTITTTATGITTTSNVVPTETRFYSNITTAVPVTTACPPISGRHFDGLSFLGGIILTVCLIGIGIFLCKYCKHVCEDKYRTL
ncbi:cell wall protein DAN4-like [Vespa velutina]|uniref:cell wall protein DAN4-like n=1 Tax=Vespa velutina TaxID=202808 RepID=UPI001FB1E9D8|nr:cell wall protein DAN4-like [Vespa velutina]